MTKSADNQRNITLPTIPRQVAEAIAFFRDRGEGTSDIAGRAMSTPYDGSYSKALRSIPFDTLMSALVNGYTVEKSAEELEREAHDNLRKRIAFLRHNASTGNQLAKVAVNEVEQTLNMLGIKIEGVNA